MNNKLTNLSYINNPKDYSNKNSTNDKDYFSLYCKYKIKYLSLKGGAAARNQGDSKLPEMKGRSVREITLTNINENKYMISNIFRSLKKLTLTEEDITHISRLEINIDIDNLDEAVKSIQYMLTFINTVNSDNEKKILFVGFSTKEVINININGDTYLNYLNAQFKFFDGNFVNPDHWENLNKEKFDYIIFDHGMHWNEFRSEKKEFPSFIIWNHLKNGGEIITPKEPENSDFNILINEFELFQLIEENFVDPVTRVNLATHNRIYFNVYQKINQNL